MMRAIAYIRVSTPGQEQGLGFQHQLARIKDYAKEFGYDVQRTFREVHSGMGANSIKAREELQKAIKCARTKRWHIIVSTLDRLGRHEESVADLQESLKREGLKVIATDYGADAKDELLRIEARDAERTGNAISSATKAALRRRKKEGKPLGNPTNLSEAQKLGAASNKRKFELMVEEYAPIIGNIIADSRKSKKQIAAALNEQGMTTSSGKPWTERNIRRLFTAVQPKLEQLKKSRQDQDYITRVARDPLFGKFP